MADANDTPKLKGWGVRVTWACAECGKAVQSRPSEKREFCSKKCANAVTNSRKRSSFAKCSLCLSAFYFRKSGHWRPTECEKCRSAKRMLDGIAARSVAADVADAVQRVVRVARLAGNAQKKKAHEARMQSLSCKRCGCFIQYVFGMPASYCVECKPIAKAETQLRNRKTEVGKALRRKAKSARRARMRGLAAHQIDPLAVFVRDKWRCKLCGKATPRSKRGTIDPAAPELDHIIPLALGGTHTWGNVQCACRACNGLKGATAVGQLGFDFAA